MLTTQKNEEIVRQLFDQALNKRNLELLKDLISEDYLGFQGLKGAPGFERTVAPLINAFPDIQYKVEDLFGKQIRSPSNGNGKGLIKASSMVSAPPARSLPMKT